MSVKITSQTYYFIATILRGDKRIKRQGTIGAVTALEAMDAIVSMAENNWRRPIVNIELYEIVDGAMEIVMTSVIGEKHQRDKLAAQTVPPKEEVVQRKKDRYEEEDDNYAAWQGFIMPTTSNSNGFYPASIGSPVYDETFATFKLNEGI